MKKAIALLSLSFSAVLLIYLASTRIRAADESSLQRFEYSTIRWAGRDNTQLIRPNGKIEKLRALFERYARPDGTDERAFYMSIAMNAAAKEGFEFAGMTPDEIVMKRAVPR